jgi:Flp pilus assembly protein TadD
MGQGRVFRIRILAALALCSAVVIASASWLLEHRAMPEKRVPVIGALAPFAPGGYAGSSACAHCHAAAFKAWAGSHHAQAMQVATKASVRGDFSGARIEYLGSHGRFFRDGSRFMVETEGADGQPGIFQVSYSFGVAPLQQYLVTFPDGRLQALPWAWDTRPRAAGGQRWFHLYQAESIAAHDPLHWTGTLQNWNTMCAACHSTGVRKRYDAAANRYDTAFSEISVGCETCHGPAAGHVAWATGGGNTAMAGHGFGSHMARRPQADWSGDPRTGSPAHGVARPPGDEVEVCAQCHSRRSTLAEDWRPGQLLTDTAMPALLDAGLFEDDGQMKDEVFNDQSFKQSLMYARGVVCSDCHDPHAGRLKLAGTAVCGQCHAPQRFASVLHTGHRAGPGAPDCISCHMPAPTYMVVDGRHDHSFRIPRPDLSTQLGTPNACNDCHQDKTATWASEAVTRWHGNARHGFQGWAEVLHAARQGDAAQVPALAAMAGSNSVPGVARATLLEALQRFPSPAADTASAAGLADPDPLVRIAALRGQAGLSAQLRWQHARGLLADPVLAVRVEAALLLADMPEAGLPADARAALHAAGSEYEAAQRLMADRPDGRAALGTFLLRRGDLTGAEAEFTAGLRLPPPSLPLFINLADLYRIEGREVDAQRVLRQAIAAAPEAASPHHALGLALVRAKAYDEGIAELGRAAALAPDEPRFAYVYAVALQSVGRMDEAQLVVTTALARNGGDPGLLSLARRGPASRQ